jgi:hypothetical protein
MCCRQVIGDRIHVAAMDIGLTRLDARPPGRADERLAALLRGLNGLKVFLSAHPLQAAVRLDLEVVYPRNYHPRWGLGWRL